MDELDTALVTLLAEDARLSVSSIARKLGMARTTVQARMERLEDKGIISGYTVRVGGEARPKLRATALVSIEPRTAPAVLSRLKSLPQVQIVHTAAGRFDLIVEIAGEETEALDETLDQIGEIKGVKGSESLIHLSTKIDRAI